MCIAVRIGGIAHYKRWQWRTLTSLYIYIDTCRRLWCFWKARITSTWDLQVKTRVFHDSWLYWYNSSSMFACLTAVCQRSRKTWSSISHLEAVSAAAHCILGLSLTLQLKEIPCWERCDWKKDSRSVDLHHGWQNWIAMAIRGNFMEFCRSISVPVPHERIDFSRGVWLMRWSEHATYWIVKLCINHRNHHHHFHHPLDWIRHSFAGYCKRRASP